MEENSIMNWSDQGIVLSTKKGIFASLVIFDTFSISNTSRPGFPRVSAKNNLGNSVSNGLYIYKLLSDQNISISNKMIFMK